MCKPHTCKFRGCEENSQVCGPFRGQKLWNFGKLPSHLQHLCSQDVMRMSQIKGETFKVRSLFDIFSSFIPMKGSRSVWPVVDTCFIVPMGLNSHKSICIHQKSPKSLREHVFWSAFSTYPMRHLHSYESPLLIQTCWQLFPCAHTSESVARTKTHIWCTDLKRCSGIKQILHQSFRGWKRFLT